MARVHLKSLILRCPAPAGAPWGVPTLCQRYCVNCIRSPISHREVNLKSLILRCHAPAGAPLGGPNPLSTLRCQLHSVPRIIHDRALAYSFLCVARALPLLHLPRFPFHDSTGFRSDAQTFIKQSPNQLLEANSGPKNLSPNYNKQSKSL